MCGNEAVRTHPAAVSLLTEAMVLAAIVQVLGAGYRFSTNPKTGDVDYIEVDSGYMISTDAYCSLAIRKSPSNESVQGILPLYLTPEHFGRAGPQLSRALKQLCPLKVGRGGTVDPAAWLDVIPKVQTTKCNRPALPLRVSTLILLIRPPTGEEHRSSPSSCSLPLLASRY